ncbi:hypothetical protein [Anaplasma centrale]|uniref:hypothetical protein n=1 Tax=Anaplasma centrale TaxID=769 RepID=UPI0005A17711|nr:hypothetical protein [Anaplasma centrale]
MPSVTGLLFLAVFGITLYVVLTYAVNQFTAWVGRRNRNSRKKTSASWRDAGQTYSKASSSAKPPQRQVSPYVGHSTVLPKSVIGVDGVSQVFVSPDRGRGR